MKDITVIEALDIDYLDVAQLVHELLLELEPTSTEAINAMNLDLVTKDLFENAKIWAFIAQYKGSAIAVITLHECASIYAGGIFGEVSELYVKPNFRSSKIGELLLRSAMTKGIELGWKRLEVGSPPENESSRTINFYEKAGFKKTGVRLRRLLDA